MYKNVVTLIVKTIGRSFQLEYCFKIHPTSSIDNIIFGIATVLLAQIGSRWTFTLINMLVSGDIAG